MTIKALKLSGRFSDRVYTYHLHANNSSLFTSNINKYDGKTFQHPS